MIRHEKEVAVQRFSDERGLTFRADLVVSVGKKPSLMQDEGFKQGGIRSAVTLYKAGLYRQGIAPSVIAEGAKALSENLSKPKENDTPKKHERKKRNAVQTSLNVVADLARVIIKHEPEKRVPRSDHVPLAPGVVRSVSRRG